MQLTRKQKIGQLFFPAAFIHDSDEGVAAIEQLIQEQTVGGLTFFYSRESVVTNFDRKQQVTQYANSVEILAQRIAHYQALSELPLLMSIDAEWGLGMRIAQHPPFPYPLTLSATNDEHLIFEVGKAIAQELRAVGIHMNLAPVVDVNLNPKNPVIGYRSLGDRPEKVAQFANAYYAGMQSEGIMGCLKHFPGHGDTAVDSHIGLPLLEKERATLLAQEVAPFRALLPLAECIMTGHLAVPALSGNRQPASLSREITTNFLKKELGYTGAVMTDALNMHALKGWGTPAELAWLAFRAGNDILSFSEAVAAGIARIDAEAEEAQVAASFAQLEKLRQQVVAHRAVPSPLLPQANTHHTLRKKIAQRAITVLHGQPVSEFKGANTFFIQCFKQEFSAHFCPTTRVKFLLNQPTELPVLMEQLQPHQQVLLSVYVPSVKPANQFELPSWFVSFLSEITRQKEVLLYVFGNPYAASILPYVQAAQCVWGYQDLPEFEAAACDFLQQAQQATGVFPINHIV